jgi:hypothetical protein
MQWNTFRGSIDLPARNNRLSLQPAAALPLNVPQSAIAQSILAGRGQMDQSMGSCCRSAALPMRPVADTSLPGAGQYP